MDKLQINRDFIARARNLGRIVCAVFVLTLFAAALAVYAASTVQADTPFTGNGAVPTTPAIYPEFSIVPRAPHLQLIAEHLYERPVHHSPTWFRGVASWYGPSFNGHVTANGEVYDMYAMTAATTEFQPRLPLGTKVKVVDIHNGRSVIVRITDRGPLPGGRIIDLSYGAAQKLAMVRPGIAHVRIQVLRWGRNVYHTPARG